MDNKKESINQFWHNNSTEYAFKQTNSSESGLTSQQADSRLKQNGEKPQRFFSVFLTLSHTLFLI